jgi:ArsR family transcriptional regulator, virulence genes transcriptional regulator
MSSTDVRQLVSKGVARSVDPEIFKLNAGLCQALANEKRIEIVFHLSDGAKSATELRNRTGLSKSSLSQHMSILVERGLARSKSLGKFVEYELSSAGVVEAYRAIAKLCRENLEQKRKLARQIP